MDSQNKLKTYHAMIWKSDPNIPGERVTIEAENLKSARKKLEEIYGDGSVYDLHNPEDAARPR